MKTVEFRFKSTEICFKGSNKQQATIGSGNGFALNRQQAIIWTNDGQVWCCIYMRHLASMDQGNWYEGNFTGDVRKF